MRSLAQVALLLVVVLAGCGGDEETSREPPTVPLAPVGRETGAALFSLEPLSVRFD